MIIGIDIDGVLADDDTYRLDYMAKYCFENNLPNLNKPYEYENKCDWNKETAEDYREKYFYDYIKNVESRRFASEITKKLHDDGHKIIIITGRYKTTEVSEIGNLMRKYTKEWLDKNNIVYDEICFAKCPKLKEVREKNIDIMIDDSPEVVNIVHNSCKVFCFDNRYNVNLECSNMTRVFSWYDIYRKIKEM